MKKMNAPVIMMPIGKVTRLDRAFLIATSRFQPQLGQQGVLIANKVTPWQPGQGGVGI
jgi:hypothetical protein